MVGSQEVGFYSFSIDAFLGFVLVEIFINLFIFVFACLFVS